MRIRFEIDVQSVIYLLNKNAFDCCIDKKVTMSFFQATETELQKAADTIIGACLGWLLTVSTGFIQSSRADKKPYKVVLFHLLKIYALVRRIEQPRLERLLKQIIKNIPLLKDVNDDDPIFALLSGALVAQQVSSMQSNDLPTLRQTYHGYVIEIAKLDPILALELSGNGNIQETLQWLDDTTGLFAKLTTEEEQKAMKVIPPFNELFKPFLLEKTLSELETDINRLIRKLPFWQRPRLKKELRLTKAEMSEEMVKTLAESLQFVLEQIVVKLMADFINPSHQS